MGLRRADALLPDSDDQGAVVIVRKSVAQLSDLRHIGGTLAAQTGATLRELMSRLGAFQAPARL